MEVQMSKRERLMKEGEVNKALISLAIPSVLAMAVMAIYNFVDTIFVGMLNDTKAMAGVSIGFPLMIIILAFGLMVGIGASTYAGRKLGAGNSKSANRTLGLAVLLGFVLSFLVMVVGFIFLKPILQFMGATPDVLPYAADYAWYMFLGSVFTVLNMVFNNMLRAEGAAHLSMVSLIIGAVINIILDPIFMFEFGLNMGLGGAALATVLSQGVTTAYLFYLYFKGKTKLKLNKEMVFTKTEEDKEIITSIIQIGLPVFLMQTLTSIATGLLNSGAALYGPEALAALGIVSKIFMIIQQVFAGYSQAFLPFTAYNVGAKRFDRVYDGLIFSLKVMIIVAVSSTLILTLFPEFFVQMFTQEPRVLLLGVNALQSQTYLLGILAYILIMTAMFQGMGKAKEAGLLSIGRQGAFFIPAVILLPTLFTQTGSTAFAFLLKNPMDPGLYGVMLAQPLADLITFFIALLMGIKVIKELKGKKEESLMMLQDLPSQEGEDKGDLLETEIVENLG